MLFPPAIEAQARRLVAVLIERDLMVSTVESCTGGLIAGALTEVPGSSAVVDRGFVTYSNEAKMDLVGVGAETLERFGAVSRETALQMAGGGLYRSRASLCVAVTGIAGPGGGSVDKPVGLVHLAVKSRSGSVLHREIRFGDLGRTEVRLATISIALEMLIQVVE